MSEVLCYSSESNFQERAQATILYNEFKNHTFEITNTSPRDQWVNLVIME